MRSRNEQILALFQRVNDYKHATRSAKLADSSESTWTEINKKVAFSKRNWETWQISDAVVKVRWTFSLSQTQRKALRAVVFFSHSVCLYGPHYTYVRQRWSVVFTAPLASIMHSGYLLEAQEPIPSVCQRKAREKEDERGRKYFWSAFKLRRGPAETRERIVPSLTRSNSLSFVLTAICQDEGRRVHAHRRLARRLYWFVTRKFCSVVSSDENWLRLSEARQPFNYSPANCISIVSIQRQWLSFVGEELGAWRYVR